MFTGKAELGQGVKTALIQIAAEELELDPTAIHLVADTTWTPDEGYTAGSQSIQNSGTAIRHAAAQVREILIAQAASRWQVAADQLRAENGMIMRADGQSLAYGDLVGHEPARGGDAAIAPQACEQLQGHGPTHAPRRHPGEGHRRRSTCRTCACRAWSMPVVRPPRPGATLGALDASAVETMPGVVAVVRNGSFLAVVAEREFQAIQAMRVLEGVAQWSGGVGNFRKPDGFIQSLKSVPSQEGVVSEKGQTSGGGRQDLPGDLHPTVPDPRLHRPVLRGGAARQRHHHRGAIRRSHPDRAAISEMLGVKPEQVRVIHGGGLGCYGHNGADDAAADAALIAQAVPGRPVRLQWMREQEHMWEPYGPAMLTEVRAALDMRAGSLRGTTTCGATPTRRGPARPARSSRRSRRRCSSRRPRNSASRPPATATATRCRSTRSRSARSGISCQDMPLRVSALRGLGAYANVFAIESTMDELALMAGADPVEFRLRHMEDPRGRAVIEAAAKGFGWSSDELPEGRGRGFAFARYKNLAAYLALALDMEVERETGRSHRPRGGGHRQRRDRQPGRDPQPDRGRHHPGGELDPLRGGLLR